MASLGQRVSDFFQKLFNPRSGTGRGFEPEEMEPAPTPDEFLRGSGRGGNRGSSSSSPGSSSSSPGSSFVNPTDYNVLRGREPRVYGDGLVPVPSPSDNEVYGRIKKSPTDREDRG